VLVVLLLLAIGAGGWLAWPFWQLVQQFGSVPTRQPSRLYGRPAELRVGAAVGGGGLEELLAERHYVPVAAGEPLVAGTFRRDGDAVTIARRRFPTGNGVAGGDRLRLRLAGGVVRQLTIDERPSSTAYLDPPLLASYYGDDLQERRPVAIDELPEDLIYAVLAAEDAAFLDHPGISLSGALRAAWVNLRAGGVRQGGSTLTQQLVKNRYLTHQRTWARKLREAVLALMIDYRYSKREILEAYLNEIYWGRSGSVDLMGVGAAAWAWFGKAPAQLTLAEAATLAGMIQSPGSYSPLHHPQATLARRDQVLERLGELGWIPEQRLAAARRAPLGTLDQPLVARRTPFFADAMMVEAQARFGVGELRDAGYVLLSTLDAFDQAQAEKAVAWGLERLEERWEKPREPPLEAALISVDPRDGAILAYVGGRDYGRSQFDRVRQARRQAGSAWKPIVYAAAYAAGLAPATPVEDAPFVYERDGQRWQPQNSDGRYRGWVTTRVALEESLNVPTARIGLRVGLYGIVDLAHRMGIASEVKPVPALSLGAMAVTPRELATAYATLANGGRRPALHGLMAVFDRHGKKLPGTPVPEPQEALRADVAYLVTHVLQGVLDAGTAKSARAQGIVDRLAGKTGTTNDRRDSWFAGYAPIRATLVWVGYDDNATTRLSGARAALPIWSRFTRAVRPAGGYPDFPVPDGVLRALIDPETGQLARTRCPRIVTELFLRDSLPATLCPRHRGRPVVQPADLGLDVERKRNPFRRWLDRIRGRRGGG